MALAISVIPCCCFTPFGKNKKTMYVTTRKLTSSFCPPDRVDTVYCNIKLIQRISFESQEVPEDTKSFKARFSHFSF